MEYMLLIYENEANRAERTGEVGGAPDLSAWHAYTEAATKAGVHRAGAGLMTTTMATTVRVRAGRTITTDGPFAETKEQLGGYYILDCADLDEAIAWATKIPIIDVATVEVRPVMR